MSSLPVRPWNGPLMNPERGLFGWSRLMDVDDFGYQRRLGFTVAFASVDLSAFRTEPLSPSRLAEMTRALDRARRAGVKVLPRFSYTRPDGEEPDRFDDASLERILGHIAQLRPVLRANADVIVGLQAGFVGAWGEWHSSRHSLDDPASVARVLGALLDALPVNRMIQIRRPNLLRDLVGPPVSRARAFDGRPDARVGYHDDCFQGSADDYGTWSGPGGPEAQRDEAAARSVSVPAGGETCKVAIGRTDCAPSVRMLRRLGWTWLNGLWEPEVLKRWRDGGCFDTIRDHLGYRLRVRDAKVHSEAQPGQRLDFEATLANDGWAPAYNRRPLVLVLRHVRSGRRLELTAPFDVRRIGPGDQHRVRLSARLPDHAPRGRWDVALWLPDEATTLRDRPDFAVRLANEGAWEEHSGLNVLGTFEVRRAAARSDCTDGRLRPIYSN